MRRAGPPRSADPKLDLTVRMCPYCGREHIVYACDATVLHVIKTHGIPVSREFYQSLIKSTR